MAVSRILRHLPFLEQLLRNVVHSIREADKAQISFLVESLHNVSKVALTRSAYSTLSKHVPIIRKIGKCRDVEEARSLLVNFGELFLPTLIPAVIQHALQHKVPPRTRNRPDTR